MSGPYVTVKLTEQREEVHAGNDRFPAADKQVRRCVDLRRSAAPDQTRKGSRVPYLGHLLSVTSLVIEAGGAETQAIAALLHDAAEDQGGEATLAKITSGSARRWLRSSRNTAAPSRHPNRRGGNASSATSITLNTPLTTPCWCRWLTSSTMPGQFCGIIGTSATTCGSASACTIRKSACRTADVT